MVFTLAECITLSIVVARRRLATVIVWKRRRRVMMMVLLILILSSSCFQSSSSTSTCFCPSWRQRAPQGIIHKKKQLFGIIATWNDSSRKRSFQAQTHRSASSSSSSSSRGDDQKWIKCEAESNFWRSVYKKVNNDDENGDENENMSTTRYELPSVDSLDSSGPLPPGAYYYYRSSKKEVSSSAKPTCRISLAIDISDPNNDELDASEMVKTMQSCLEDGLSSFQLLTTTSESSFQTEEQQQWVEENVYQRLLAETPAFALSQCHLTIPFFMQHGSTTTTSTATTKQQQQQQQRPSTTPNMSIRSTLKLVRQQVAESLLRMGGAESIDCLQLIQPEDQDNVMKHHLYYLDVLDALQDLQREGLVQSVSLVPSRYSIANPAAAAALSSSWRTMDGTSLWNNNVVDSIQMPINLLENDEALAFYSFLEQQQQQTQNNDNNNMKRRIPPAILASTPLAGVGFLTDRFVHEESENLSLQFLGSERFAFEDYVRATTTTSTTISKEEMSSLWNHYQKKLLPALTEIAWKHGVVSGGVSCVSLRWLLQCKNNHVASVVVPTSLNLAENENGNPYYDNYSMRNGRFRQRRPKSLYKQLRDVFTFQLDEEDLERLAQLSKDFTALKPAKKGRHYYVDPIHAEWQQEDPESYYREMMENGGDNDERMTIDFKNPKLWL